MYKVMDLLGDTYDFSFSGLKTAVLRVVQKYTGTAGKLHPSGKKPRGGQLPLPTMPVADIAASFQMAVVDVLVDKTKAAADEYEVAEVLLAGGVSANTLLRDKMTTTVNQPIRVPPLALCTDNAAMIGAAAHWHFQAGQTAAWDLDVVANLRLG